MNISNRFCHSLKKQGDDEDEYDDEGNIYISASSSNGG